MPFQTHFSIKIRDIAYKYGSGTASIGLKRYYILVEDEKGASGVENLVLEMKEVRTAIPPTFFPIRIYFGLIMSTKEHE